VIGAGITLIFFVIYRQCELSATPGPEAGFGCSFILLFSPMFPIALLLERFLNSQNLFVILSTVSVSVWFAIGALIGAFWRKFPKWIKVGLIGVIILYLVLYFIAFI